MLILFWFEEHSLDMHTAHSENASQLSFLRQFATHGLLPVYGQLCAFYTNHLADICRDAQKKKTHFWSEGETNLLLTL